MKRRICVISLLFALLLLTGCHIVPDYQSDVTSGTHVPSLKIDGSFTGCAIGVFLHDGEPTTASINTYESWISREVAAVMWFRDFTADLPKSSCNTVYSHGCIPMIAWEPWIGGNASDMTYSLASIIAGSHDTYIRKFATDVKSLGKPIFIRFAHEMNLASTAYPWVGQSNGNSGANYIAAWRRIHATFEAVGAKNVNWVWCPNNSSDPAASWNTAECYYPGDDYVDWIGIDGYNWGDTRSWSDWQTFSQIFQTPYNELTILHPTKPFMIGEMSCTTDEGSNTKSDWINDTFYQIKNNYPKLKAYIWFDLNKECSWAVNVPIICKSTFEAAMSDTYYISTIEWQ